MNKLAVLMVDDFLPLDDFDALANRLTGQRIEQYFDRSTIDSGRFDANMRSSESAAPILPSLEKALHKIAKRGLAYLGLSSTFNGALEYEVTRHGDGGFYGAHADVSGHDAGPVRVLTFVLYLRGCKDNFTGGELRLLGAAGRPAVDIIPLRNRLVIFDPRVRHEVRLVKLLDGGQPRMAINGWFLGEASIEENA